MRKKLPVLFAIFAAVVNSVAAAPHESLKTVDSVDIARYCGLWYEIARLPNPFEKDCVAVTAQYSLLPNGNISVINSCNYMEFTGKKKIARGKAWVTDKHANSKLRVMFFWPFSGAYWILGLGDNYEYALVGEPKRKYLWILARSSSIDDALYNSLLAKAESMGFDTSKIIKTPQR